MPQPRVLAAARVLAGLTQRELAGEAGVAASSVGRYEAGLSSMRVDTLRAILVVLAKRGVRFVDETATIATGVLLIKGE